MSRGRSSSRVPLLVAGFLAIALILAGKAHFVPFERARAALTDRSSAAMKALNAPVEAAGRWLGGVGHFFDVYSENRQLREENARLLQWHGAAVALQDRVKHYQLLLKTVPEPSSSAVTAQVIGRSSQPFLETLVLNAGRRNGIKSGQAVVDARGLLGRIYVVGDHTSWVILLTDLNSRIPVTVRPGNLQAILSGTNTNTPSLEALPQNAKVKEGQDVVTSGDGGLLPAGLPVGVLTLQEHYPRVRLYADAQTADEVRILDFQSPAEPMPKPTDKELPVPDKLTPPPPETAPAPPPAITGAAPSRAAQATPRVPAKPRQTIAAPQPENAAGQQVAAPVEQQATEPPPPQPDQTDDQDNNQ
ncbi:MAG TPA: rod shape-determining protein MreC [Rhizomicrobium sp.]|jgi:rod shape-determining protein MreC|nr:rod shape-determining protein MreC [Rhizomicrobium sp.]